MPIRKGQLFMTRAMFTRSVVAFFAMLALVLPVRSAEEPKAASQPYVVLVGISKYADKQIKPRPHAEDDAKALYDLFTNKEYLGVDAKHVRCLLGSEDAKRGSQPATRENILKALQWVADKAQANDLVIFAFFGEGGAAGRPATAAATSPPTPPSRAATRTPSPPPKSATP